MEIGHIQKNTPCFELRKECVHQKVRSACPSEGKESDGQSEGGSEGKREGKKKERKIRSLIFRPCACINCEETDVRVFQVRQMRDYLKILGGPVVKAKGKYFGGLSALRKIIYRKRITLCRTHFMMMEKGRLRFSNLSVTEKFHTTLVRSASIYHSFIRPQLRELSADVELKG